MEVVPEGSAAQRHQGQQGFSNLLLLLNVDPTVYAIRWGQLRYSTIRKRSFEVCNCLQNQLEEEFAAVLELYLLNDRSFGYEASFLSLIDIRGKKSEASICSTTPLFSDVEIMLHSWLNSRTSFSLRSLIPIAP